MLELNDSLISGIVDVELFRFVPARVIVIEQQVRTLSNPSESGRRGRGA
jgi:hypothetical protein